MNQATKIATEGYRKSLRAGPPKDASSATFSFFTLAEATAVLRETYILHNLCSVLFGTLTFLIHVMGQIMRCCVGRQWVHLVSRGWRLDLDATCFRQSGTVSRCSSLVSMLQIYIPIHRRLGLNRLLRIITRLI